MRKFMARSVQELHERFLAVTPKIQSMKEKCNKLDYFFLISIKDFAEDENKKYTLEDNLFKSHV